MWRLDENCINNTPEHEYKGEIFSVNTRRLKLSIQGSIMNHKHEYTYHCLLAIYLNFLFILLKHSENNHRLKKFFPLRFKLGGWPWKCYLTKPNHVIVTLTVADIFQQILYSQGRMRKETHTWGNFHHRVQIKIGFYKRLSYEPYKWV